MLTLNANAQPPAASQAPWALSEAPTQYVDALVRAVVGIEIPIERLVGKLKVSQYEALEDRLGTVAGLQARCDEDAAAMASLVKEAMEKRQATFSGPSSRSENDVDSATAARALSFVALNLTTKPSEASR
jgi:N12 class adenine-specific DNA methylase